MDLQRKMQFCISVARCGGLFGRLAFMVTAGLLLMLVATAGSRLLRIAVVNISDQKGAALTLFFQGSSSGRATQQTLCATFAQPQLSSPLLDGVVVLYNDMMLPPMDNVDPSGLLTPGKCGREIVGRSGNAVSQ